MSWEVNVIENTLKVSVSAREPFMARFRQQYSEPDANEFMPDVDGSEGLLCGLWFNPDWMEWIDYLEADFAEILVAHGARGVVTFGTTDGGGGGPSFWGHRFDENGYTRLRGRVVFDPDAEQAVAPEGDADAEAAEELHLFRCEAPSGEVEWHSASDDSDALASYVECYKGHSGDDALESFEQPDITMVPDEQVIGVAGESGLVEEKLAWQWALENGRGFAFSNTE